jgi:hypothetical protein
MPTIKSKLYTRVSAFICLYVEMCVRHCSTEQGAQPAALAAGPFLLREGSIGSSMLFQLLSLLPL